MSRTHFYSRLDTFPRSHGVIYLLTIIAVEKIAWVAHWYFNDYQQHLCWAKLSEKTAKSCDLAFSEGGVSTERTDLSFWVGRAVSNKEKARFSKGPKDNVKTKTPRPKTKSLHPKRRNIQRRWWLRVLDIVSVSSVLWTEILKCELQWWVWRRCTLVNQQESLLDVRVRRYSSWDWQIWCSTCFFCVPAFSRIAKADANQDKAPT